VDITIRDGYVTNVSYSDMFSGYRVVASSKPFTIGVNPPSLRDDLWNSGFTVEDVGDYNGDGIDDFLIAKGGTLLSPLLYVSEGNGSSNPNFNLAHIEGDSTIDILGEAFSADFDDDGDTDIFATINGIFSDYTDWPAGTVESGQFFGASGGSLLLRNDGQNRFTAVKQESAVFHQFGIDLQNEHGGDYSDIDNDGDLDIFSLEADGTTGPNEGMPVEKTYLENLGGGRFMRSDSFIQSKTSLLTTGAIRFADLNNDGVEDYVVSTGFGSSDLQADIATAGLHVYLNDGDGDLSNDDFIHIQHHWAEKYPNYDSIPIDEGNIKDPEAADYDSGYFVDNFHVHFLDINNDGFLDILNGQKLYNPHHGTGGGFQLFLNKGGSGFEEDTASYFPNLDIYQTILTPALPDITRVTHADLNGDGALDIIFELGEGTPSDWDKPEYPLILLNVDGKFFPLAMDNAGSLVQARPDGGYDSIAGSPVAGDFNGDGLTDLLTITFLRDDGENGLVIDHKGNGTDWGISIHYGKYPSPDLLTIRGTGTDNVIDGGERDELFIPGLGEDVIDGSEGTDTVMYWFGSSEATLIKMDDHFKCSNADGSSQDTLFNTERVVFSDSATALDLDGNAGSVAKILGAVFGAEQVSNKEYAGIGLSYLDSGYWNFQTLGALAMGVRAPADSTEICAILWENVVGSPAESSDIAPFVSMLDNDDLSVGSLVELAANTALNLENINFVGLQATGLEYTPFG